MAKKAALSDKQKRFVVEYLKDLNASEAARRAGYSRKNAACIGHETRKRPLVAAAIEKRLKEVSMSADETIKLINDIARGNLADYYITTKVEHTPRIQKALATVIAEKRLQINFEEEFAVAAQLKGDELKRHRQNVAAMEREIIRLQLELKHNPKAFRIVSGQTVLIDHTELDMKKLIADKEKGRIKSIKPTENGMQVELYGADNALMQLAKMHGLFEKDNAQRKSDIAAVVFIGDEAISPG